MLKGPAVPGYPTGAIAHRRLHGGMRDPRRRGGGPENQVRLEAREHIIDLLEGPALERRGSPFPAPEGSITMLMTVSKGVMRNTPPGTEHRRWLQSGCGWNFRLEYRVVTGSSIASIECFYPIFKVR